MEESIIIKVQTLIESEKFSQADKMLNKVDESERCARWNYLKGVVLTNRGWNHDAQKHFETAHALEPENEEYSLALIAFRRKERFGTSEEGTAIFDTTSSKICRICFWSCGC